MGFSKHYMMAYQSNPYLTKWILTHGGLRIKLKKLREFLLKQNVPTQLNGNEMKSVWDSTERQMLRLQKKERSATGKTILLTWKDEIQGERDSQIKVPGVILTIGWHGYLKDEWEELKDDFIKWYYYSMRFLEDPKVATNTFLHLSTRIPRQSLH